MSSTEAGLFEGGAVPAARPRTLAVLGAPLDTLPASRLAVQGPLGIWVTHAAAPAARTAASRSVNWTFLALCRRRFGRARGWSRDCDRAAAEDGL